LDEFTNKFDNDVIWAIAKLERLKLWVQKDNCNNNFNCKKLVLHWEILIKIKSTTCLQWIGEGSHSAWMEVGTNQGGEEK
jgi:hypothetical protein